MIEMLFGGSLKISLCICCHKIIANRVPVHPQYCKIATLMPLVPHQHCHRTATYEVLVHMEFNDTAQSAYCLQVMSRSEGEPLIVLKNDCEIREHDTVSSARANPMIEISQNVLGKFQQHPGNAHLVYFFAVFKMKQAPL